VPFARFLLVVLHLPESKVNGNPSKALSALQARGHYALLPLRVQDCSLLHQAPLHPLSKLRGILAKAVKRFTPFSG
jgi:hypothetical protein